MSLYLCRARYGIDAFKGMIAKPEDRSTAGRAMFEAAGMKLLHTWFSVADYEMVMVVEGDGVAGAAVGMVAMASGAFTEVHTEELITGAQHEAAMRAAAEVATKYRPPGR
jgi:uncharacterized protein with GYD domain